MHMDSVHAMPLIEDGFGMHGRRNGPWTMHMFYEQALAFASAYPTVQAETEAGSMCELKVTPLRIMEEEAAQPKYVFATATELLNLSQFRRASRARPLEPRRVSMSTQQVYT